MEPSQPTDTLVIFYVERRDCWAAISLQTRHAGIGKNPNDALANAITTADQATEALAEHPNVHVSSSMYDLMQILGKTAQPLPDGTCVPGVVYKCEWTWPR